MMKNHGVYRAEARISAADLHVEPVTPEIIAKQTEVSERLEKQQRDGVDPTPKPDAPSSGDIAFESVSTSPTSKNSDEPSSGSTRRWRQPRNVREFAAQANAVATMVLNGDMPTDTARTYSSVARTVAQAMSTEVSKARFVKQEPQLTLSENIFEESLGD